MMMPMMATAVNVDIISVRPSTPSVIARMANITDSTATAVTAHPPRFEPPFFRFAVRLAI